MSSPWEDILAEQAYLVQLLSDVAHDPGALEHTHSLLKSFHAELRECTIQVADMERERRDPSAGTKHHHDSKIATSASRIFHRVAASVGSEKDKEQTEEERKEHLGALWTKKRTLNAEVKNLHVKAQVLERRHRHFDDIKKKLTALYSRLPDAKMPLSREEDEAEEDLRRNQRALHDAQKAFDQHKTLVALLTQGDVALINAARHLSPPNDETPAGDIKAAMTCSVQTSIVVDQARCILPEFFKQEKTASVFKTGWLADVFNPRSPHGTVSIQSLQPHHTALISLISDARKLAKSHAETVQRVTNRCIESQIRRHGLRRRVIMEYANADAETWTDMEEELELAIKDITVGLDKAIPIIVPNSAGVSAPPPPPSSVTHGTSSVPNNRSGDLPPMPQAHAEPKSRQVPLSVPNSHSDDLPPIPQAHAEPKSRPVLPSAQPGIRQVPSTASPHPQPPLSEATLRSSQPNVQPPVAQALFSPSTSVAEATSQPPVLTQPVSLPLAPNESASPPSEATLRSTQPSGTQRPPVAVESALALLEPQHEEEFVQLTPGPNLYRSQTISHQSSPPPIQRQRSQSATPTPPRSVDLGTYTYYRPSATGAEPPDSSRRSQPNNNSDSRLQSGLSTRSQSKFDPRVQLAAQLSSKNNSDPGLQSISHPYPPSNPSPRLQPGPEASPAPPSEIPSPQQSNVYLPSRPDLRQQPSLARRLDQADSPRLPPQPRLNPPTLSQIQIPPVHGHGIALDAASEHNDSATSSNATSVSAISGSTRLQKPIHGILKMQPATPVAAVAAVASNASDPWGVKAASAGSSRSQPKLKTMFNLFRGSEGLKGSKNSPPVTVTPTTPLSATKFVNPRAVMQKLRFIDGVQVIQRPEVDSYPYEDDEMEEEVLPPSPKRGSRIWLQDPENPETDIDDSEEGHGPLSPSSSSSHHIGSVPVLPVPSIHTDIPHTLPITSPLSTISPFTGSPSSFQDYYLSSDNELATTPDRSKGSFSSSKEHLQSLSNRLSHEELSVNTSSGSVESQTHPLSSSPQSVRSHTSHLSFKSDHELLQAIFPSPPTAKPARDFMFS